MRMAIAGLVVGMLPVSAMADHRDYGIGSQILRFLGVKRMRLMTNNPKKIVGLEGYGLEITEQVSIRVKANPHNQRYLDTKRTKLGHLI